jgi:CheY-like chemotaxis protein
MSKTILAVDDSPSIRNMVAFTLKSAGYEVVEAVDGQDGLDKAKELGSATSQKAMSVKASLSGKFANRKSRKSVENAEPGDNG